MSNGDVALVDVLDRLLDRGAALQGDLVVSVAGVDLVWLGLKAVLAGAEHAPAGARLDERANGARLVPAATGHGREPVAALGTPTLSSRPAPREPSPRRVGLSGERMEQGLVRLVLSVVELLRQLMERQAIRRIDDPSLGEDQIEELGLALMQLEERMEDLKEHFGLQDDDLELSLGSASELP